MRPELTEPLKRLAERAEGVLATVLPPATQEPCRLHEAMRYSVLGGGKRLRPMLCYAGMLAVGGQVAWADRAAAALEIIHAYSLIHDDLPAMDDDDLRRGKPTCHIAFDEATAILAGDALQALAFELIADDPQGVPERARLAAIRTLAVACGSQGMAGGQAFDLAAVGQVLSESELKRMHAHKTGALIRAAVLMGAELSGQADSRQITQLARYGSLVGLGFQIKDDILDIEGSTEAIGKRQGADIARNKPTFPSIMGLASAKAAAEHTREQALAALESFGAEADLLRDLAHYSVDRNN